MRRTFLLMLLALGLASIGVWRLQPQPAGGRIEMIRVSDLNPLRQAQNDLFNRLHPALHVTVDPDGGVEKIIVQSLGGVGPDLFDAFDPFELSSYVQSGIAWDLTDELKRRGVDLTGVTYAGVLPTAVYQGKTYGIPTNFASDGLWFHRDIFASAGIPAHSGSWTWAEFIPIAQRLTVRDPNGRVTQYGFLFDWTQWRDFFAGFGATVFSPDGTRCVLAGPEAVAAVNLMHELVYKYRVSSTPVEEASMATAGGFGSGGLTLFGAKHAAIALGGRWWLAELRGYKGVDLGVMEAPHGTVRRFFAYGRATLINKASPNREAALDYLLYQLGPEYNELVNAQADGISAYPKYNERPGFLHDPAHPEERDNAVWRGIASYSIGADSSPYISGQLAGRLIQDQVDLVKADEKTAEAAMRDAAAAINAEIARNVRESPDLARKYREAGGAE